MGIPAALLTRIEQIAESATDRVGVSLVDVVLRRRGKDLHIVITIDKDGGVTVDHCQHVSEAVRREIDQAGLLADFTLEVESPGLDRKLRSDREFNYFKGREIEVTTFAPFEGRRRFTGRLMGIEDGTVLLIEENGQSLRIPREQVAGAKLVVRF